MDVLRNAVCNAVKAPPFTQRNENVLKGKIIIEPIAPKRTRLEDLLAGITPDNIHAEESFGRPEVRQ